MSRRHAATVSSDAEALQGRPAGLVSRTLAAAVDAGVVATMVAGVYAGAAAVLFAWSPRSFRFPDWPGAVLLAIAGTLEVTYLAVAWWLGGRTYGCTVMGLRVVSSSGLTLPVRWALLRAAVCTVFPLGLLWCAVDGRGLAVHDLLARSRVVYDWRQRER